jgi:hypothetical protein
MEHRCTYYYFHKYSNDNRAVSAVLSRWRANSRLSRQQARSHQQRRLLGWRYTNVQRSLLGWRYTNAQRSLLGWRYRNAQRSLLSWRYRNAQRSLLGWRYIN